MHEMSIAQAIVEQAEAVMRQEGAMRVTAVSVSVGRLSGVDRGALEFAFPFVARNTPAEGATLAIEEIPAELTCRVCKATTNPDLPFLVCERCGSADVELLCGRELQLKTVELATD